MSARPVQMNSFFEKDGRITGGFRASAWRANLRPGWTWIFAALPLCAAEGQEALLNAISLDNTIAAQSNVPSAPTPDRPHLGPVQLNLGAYAGLAYNDNINGSQYNAQADEISQTGASLGFDWPATDHSDVQLGTGIGYLHYFKYTSNNGLEINPDSALTYALSLNDVIFTFYDQFSFTRQVTTEAALANESTQPVFNNTAGVRTSGIPANGHCRRAMVTIPPCRTARTIT